MQNPFQPAQALLTFAIVLLFSTFASISCRADGRDSPVKNDPPSKVQLLNGGPLQDKPFYHAGIEIDLAPGALTYWRMAGDAGVPPSFSFDGSQNVKSAQVFFPAPSRLNEAGETAFGYKDRVLFPLHVTPTDPGKPIELNLKLDYAVCTKICLPETARLSLELGPTQIASHSVETELYRAETSLPKSLTDSQAAIFTRFDWAEEESSKNGLPSWKLTWLGAPAEDLFVEAPEGWYFETKKTSDPNVFFLTAVEHPADGTPSTRPEITVTLLEKDQSFEFKTQLKPSSEPN